MDEGLEQGFAGGRVAVGDDVGDVGLEGVQVVVGEWFALVFVFEGEFGAACFELVEALGEFGDAGCAGGSGHGGVFEGVEVAVEGVVGFAELGVEALQFGGAFGLFGVEFGEGRFDFGADVGFAAEQGGELVEDRLFELLGR